MKIRTVANIDNVRNRRYDRSRIPRFTADQVKEFESVFRFLNCKDRDILYLIFVNKKRQSSVERILQRSQPSLCYDIKRIRHRIQFIVYLCSVVDLFLDFLDGECGAQYTSFERDVLASMFFSTSLTHTASVLKRRQIRVRYVFEKTLLKMRRLKHWDVYELFMTIRGNLNIIRRVYSPRNISRKPKKSK